MPCEHINTTFSRDHCPEPCGTMHYICTDCHEIVDPCYWDDV